MKRIFVYGSLKKGFYNHTSWNFNLKTQYLGPAIMQGASLYAMKWYPCAVRTGNMNDVVHGDLYEFIDDEIIDAIRRVEEGAGYREHEVVIDGIKTIVYLYDEVPDRSEYIPDGSWTGNVEEKICR